MRPFTLAGIALIVVGAFVLYNGGAFTTHREVMHMGSLTMTAEAQHPVRPWIAGIAVAAGIALVVAGARRKA